MPSRSIRLICWLGLYVIASLGLFILVPGLRFAISTLLFWPPLGLYLLGDYFVPGIVADYVLLLAAFAFYPVHFVFSLAVSSRSFLYLQMAILIFALTLSAIGVVCVPGWEFTRDNGFRAFPQSYHR